MTFTHPEGDPPGYRQLLRENGNLRRLWYGQVVSQMGDWFSGVAVSAMLIERAGASAGTAVALYTVARHLPLFLLGPAAGIAADRFDRRRVLIAADLVRAVLALAYLLVLGGGPLWVLYAASAGLSGVSIFFNSARGALLPNVTTRRQLMVANALSAATFGSTLAVGSLLGGVVSGTLGRAPAFVLNAASFVVSAFFVAGIRPPARAASPAHPHGTGPTLWADLRAGLAAVRHTPLLLGLVLLPAGWALGTGAARVVYSIYGARLGEQALAGAVRHPRDLRIALLYAAMGCGALLGTFQARRLAGRRPDALLRAVSQAVLLDGLGLLAFGFAGSLPFAAAVLILRETGYSLWWTSQQTLVMLQSPDAVRGRVFSLQDSLTTLALLVSMIVAGPAVDRIGLQPVTMAAGGAIVVAGLGFWGWRRTPAALGATEQ